MKRVLLFLACLMFCRAPSALAQSGANVLLIVNGQSAASGRIGDHYARVRAVPSGQVLRITVDVADEIERSVFEDRIQSPITRWLQQHDAQDRILYIVLTKGIPLRIKGTPDREGTRASVDSELTMLYRRLTGADAPLAGRLANPYFLGAGAVAQATAFHHQAFDLYLVTRLDGYTVDDVIGLIDRGAAPVQEGRILLDQLGGPTGQVGDAWLKSGADTLTAIGFGDRVRLDTSANAVTGEKGLLGYYSWGSNDRALKSRRPGLSFVPGALAGMYVSTDARTFIEPPAEWTTGRWLDRITYYAGSPQSLTGDLIREGVTGVAGHVAEPFLDAAIRPDILFPAYLSGFNLAESFYLATPYLSWQAVVIGDPLCAPFPRKPLQAADLDNGLDPATELPAYFSARRLSWLATQMTTKDAAAALMRAEARTAKGDRAGSQRALEEATKLDPKLAIAQLMLAAAYEDEKAYDKAIERYRTILAVSPNNVAALNNLAYALAIRKGQPAEGLGHAERAMALTGGKSPEIADTLAWIQHLVGRDAEAAQLLQGIVKAAPERAEIRLHAAVVFAAVGRLEEAAAELGEAVRLDPALEASADVQALRAKLKKGARQASDRASVSVIAGRRLSVMRQTSDCRPRDFVQRPSFQGLNS
jgi:uncharacterized protein (TIGR03790 family)